MPAPRTAGAGACHIVEGALPRQLLILGLTAFALVGLPLAGTAVADELEFTEEFMADPETIELGRDLFRQRCRLCHGRGAYPGKAPPLRPDRLSPEDIYLRITYGFGRMPAWEDQFTVEERRSITAYMKSPRFGN
jgi:mono/diheme cytochrome c family protein